MNLKPVMHGKHMVTWLLWGYLDLNLKIIGTFKLNLTWRTSRDVKGTGDHSSLSPLVLRSNVQTIACSRLHRSIMHGSCVHSISLRYRRHKGYSSALSRAGE